MRNKAYTLAAVLALALTAFVSTGSADVYASHAPNDVYSTHAPKDVYSTHTPARDVFRPAGSSWS